MLEFLYSTSINRYFLSDVLWNLLLATIPCLLSGALYAVFKKRTWKQLSWPERTTLPALFLLWLFFLPNTIYLITMVRHLINYCAHPPMSRVCPKEMWEIMFFFVYAAMGIPTFIYSLERVNRTIQGIFGKGIATIMPIVIIPISTIGLMIGLARRVNSWDIIQYPAFILKDTLYYFTRPYTGWNFVAYLIGGYILYYGGLWSFKKILKP